MIVRLFVAVVGMMSVYGVVLFGFAGTLAWPQAWVFLIEVTVTSLAVSLWLARHDPALLAERLRGPAQKEQTAWDRVFMPLVMIVFVAWTGFMGWDWRRGERLPVAWEVLGFVLIATCMWICLLTFKANPYAAPVVKLQVGHRVADTGPYSIVRHPMYAGAILYFIGAPLLLGVWRGLVLVPVLVALLGVRAVGEERLLTDGLVGYADYARRVRYRFAPFVW